MMPEALLILFIYGGDHPVVKVVPWPVCVAIHRNWRYADASGKRYIMMDAITREKAVVRDVRCEDRNRIGVPTS